MAPIQARPVAWSARPVAMIGRPPIRSESSPAIGAIRIGIAVQGRMRRPDWSGEAPCTVWKYWASRKIEPNIPTNMNSEATLAAVKVRLRKKRIGSIGASARSSQRTNSASTSAPPSRAATTSSDGQQPGGREGEAAQVEPARRSAGLLELPQRERDQHEPEGHVQPEDPLPGDALHDRAADERAERDGQAADA